MEVYKLEVYLPTRKSEQIFVTKIFKSENTQNDLYNKFIKDYSGFGVRVIPIETVSVEVVELKDCARKESGLDKVKTSTITIEIDFTEEEMEMRKQIDRLRREADKADKELKKLIESRYDKAMPRLGSVRSVVTFPEYSYISPFIEVTLSRGVQSVTEYIQESAQKQSEQ